MGDASKYLTHSLGDNLMTLSEAEEEKLRHQEAPVAITLDYGAFLHGLHQYICLGLGYLKHIYKTKLLIQTRREG